MNRPFLTTLALVAAASAVGFQGSRFKYSDGNLTLLAQSGRAVQSKTGDYTFTVKGAVSISSKKEGFTMTTDRVVCETVQSAGKQTELRHAVATGRVHLVKTVTSPAGRQVTDITGSAADLRKVANGDVVNLEAPVRIQNSDQVNRKTMVATGSKAVATLAPGVQSSFSSGLRHATLSGPVRVTIVQAPVKGRGASTLVATGNRMDLTYSGGEPVIVLTGNVSIHGEGDSRLGQFTGLRKATVHLNAKGEVVGFDTEAG
jgi:hypothetical protein